MKNIKNNTVAGHIALNELDTHADTCCAGANWSLMEYTGEICDVNPFLDAPDPGNPHCQMLHGLDKLG
jgi:hypothetical protein